MKLYWAHGRGAIIGSANLSTNALGSGGLKELAVRVPDKAVPIAAILRAVRPRAVSEKELNKLERAHRRLGRQFTGSEPRIGYKEWFESKHRNRWKLGWWVEPVGFSKKAKNHAKEDFGRAPINSIWGHGTDFTRDDWILTFRLSDKRAWEPRWLYVNFVVRAGDKKETFPYEAVQVWKMKECTIPPFSLRRGFGRL